MIIPRYHERELRMFVAGRLSVCVLWYLGMCAAKPHLLTSFVVTGCLSVISRDACVYVSTDTFMGAYCIFFVWLMFLASGGALYTQIHNLRIRIFKLKGTLCIF